ncbi:hypothetical protein ACFL3G_07920, partial [Planctomycetota bacterium]
MNKLALIILILLINPPIFAQDAHLYVAIDGSDKNPGTQAKPFATINAAQKAVRKMIANGLENDVTVLIAGGTYTIDKTITFTPADSGTDQYRIIYANAPGQTVIISGGKQIKKWKKTKNGLWKAKTKIDNFRQLYINGKKAQRAKSPDIFLKKGEQKAWWQNGRGPYTGIQRDGDDGYRSDKPEMAKWKNQSDIEFIYFVGWTHTRCKVEAITRDGDQAVIKMLQPHY